MVPRLEFRSEPGVVTLYIRGADGGRMTAVLLQTTVGDVRIELFHDSMPITAGNFLLSTILFWVAGRFFHAATAAH